MYFHVQPGKYQGKAASFVRTFHTQRQLKELYKNAGGFGSSKEIKKPFVRRDTSMNTAVRAQMMQHGQKGEEE